MIRDCKKCFKTLTRENGFVRGDSFRGKCKKCFAEETRKSERLRKGVIQHPCEVCNKMCYKKFYRAFCSELCKFYGYVIKTDSCWKWLGRKNHDGYGEIGINGAVKLAHRYSYDLHRDNKANTLNKDIYILHSCDNRICVNPKHLRAGTARDNTDDMIRRNKILKGSQVGNSLLDEKKVIEIRERYANGETKKVLAQEFNVDKTTIHSVVKRYSWKHI